MIKALRTVGKYIMLMGRVFARPERMRMFFRQYINEIEQLGVNSIGIVLLISFFIGAVITIQIKLNIESPFMPRWTARRKNTIPPTLHCGNVPNRNISCAGRAHGVTASPAGTPNVQPWERNTWASTSTFMVAVWTLSSRITNARLHNP